MLKECVSDLKKDSEDGHEVLSSKKSNLRKLMLFVSKIIFLKKISRGSDDP